jgi:4-amino-4-deoxy-L-arabinose transferase-like glycosyltransferase
VVDARHRRRWRLVAIASLVFAFAFLIQPAGDNEKSHYALVRALADGRPYVDEVRTNPHLATIDVTEYHGHWYAAKSPGLALVSLPPYLVLKAAGVRTDGDVRRIVWALHLWSVVLPGLVLLLLVERLGDRFEPGLGIAGAVALGASTLVLPFSTLFFSHVLAAALALGSFALLWRERGRAPRAVALAAAGALCGFGVSTESSLLLAALVLGIYACLGPERVRRAAAFGAGFAVGVLPTLLFNWWAFGSPLHSPYEGWHRPGQEAASTAFGFGVPTLRSLLVVLLFPTGLPLLTAGLAGTIVLLRRQRAEAVVILATAAAFVLANATSPDLLGGASPGPRYLIPAFPFLALGIPTAFRRFPGATAGLACAGAVVLTAATITSPLGAFDQHVIQRLRAHSFVGSALELVGVTSGYPVVAFVAAVALALLAGALAGRLLARVRHELARAAIAAVAFAMLMTQLPDLLAENAPSRDLLFTLLLALAAAAAVLVVHRIPADGRMDAERAS